jgi:cellulose biosynthesis protein BcsQ
VYKCNPLGRGEEEKMKKIGVISTKGGVGKSTLIKLLAHFFELKQQKTLVVDLCQNSIATRYFYDRTKIEWSINDWLQGAHFSDVKIDVNEWISIIAATDEVDDLRLHLKKKYKSYEKRINILSERLAEIDGDYSLAMIDNHPSEDERIIWSLFASDIVLIPVMMDIDSVVASQRVTEIIHEVEEHFGIKRDVFIVPMNLDVKMKSLLTYFEGNVTPPIRRSTVIPKIELQGIELGDVQNKYLDRVMLDVEKVVEHCGI